VEKAEKSNKPQLLTIPYSHYVELARWSWLLGNKSFEENWYMPGQHILPLLSLRVSGKKKHLSSSSFVTKSGRDPSTISDKKASASRSTAVPALVKPNGDVLTDSWVIANESGLIPLTDPNLKKMYDEELGPLTRQFAYNFLLKPEHRQSWDDLLKYMQGWIWIILYFFIGNYLHSLMSRMFGLGKQDLFEKCENDLDELFERIAKERLPENSRYINGDELSVEDIALCSLAAPALIPEKYCGGSFTPIFYGCISKDKEFQLRLEKYRATAVGKYVMQFYDENRKALPI